MMKNIIYSLSHKAFLLCFVLLFISFADVHAQGDRFDANFYVSQKTFGKNSKPKYSKVRYHVCNNLKQAQDFAQRLKDAFKRDDLPGSMGDELDKTIASFRFQFKESRANGTFTQRVSEGMGMLILGDDGVETIEIKAGKEDYNVMIQGRASLEISQVDVTAKKKAPVFKKVPSTDTGWEVSFNINANIPAGVLDRNSRLMIQPMITDCQTDDTVDYLAPLVYEGSRYHKLQDKYMGFDYEFNDPVAVGYRPDIVLKENTPFFLDTNVVYKKPNKDKTYKCAYYVTAEDYTHKFFDNGGAGTGSCLSFKPFKFLNFDVVTAKMPLTSEFYDQAESQVRDVPRNLSLRFVVGTDKLTKDSLNDVELGKLSQEMSSYGDRLTEINVEGAASPEGTVKFNTELAKKRAIHAQQLLKNRLGSNMRYVRLPEPKVTVHTWEDVAKAMEKGDTAHLAEVRSIISAKGEDGAFSSIKNLPYYATEIIPILESQRVMKCSYQYEIDHIMNADEATSEYFAHKDEYISGKKDLSDGDYYNLFASITDSAELAVLTDVAYRHMVKQPAYELLKLSPYIANLKALQNIKNGVYDPNILRPFIDFSVGSLNSKDQSTGMVRNRRQIMINQAITYFQDQKLDTAQFIIDKVKSNGIDESVVKLSKFIVFVREFFKTSRTPEEEAEFQSAYDFVLNSSPDNRAVLYSELHGQLGKTREEAEEWINKLDDKSPKKWYLLGIVWADEAGHEPAFRGEGSFKTLTDQEYMELQSKDPEKLVEYNKALDAFYQEQQKLKQLKVPFYLAFFQHAFDLEPKFVRLYFNEGNVSDDVRKAHPYHRADIPKYRNMFDYIMMNRNAEKAEAAENAAKEQKAEETQGNSNEQTQNNEGKSDNEENKSE